MRVSLETVRLCRGMKFWPQVVIWVRIKIENLDGYPSDASVALQGPHFLPKLPTKYMLVYLSKQARQVPR